MAETGQGRGPGKRPAARGAAFYPRKRANTACQVCRARKTKCDNDKPSCSYCRAVGATCVQSPVDLSSFDPASLKILERLDELEQLLQKQAGHGQDNGGTSPSWADSGAVVVPAEDASEAQRRRSDHVPAAPPGTSPSPSLRSVLPERVEQMLLQWPLFSVSSPCNSGLNSTDWELAAETLPAACATMSLHEPRNFDLAEVEPQRTTHLLDNFFMYVHCKNPILDEASARRLVRRAVLEGFDWSPSSCLALIICALGCVSGPFGPSHHLAGGTQASRDSQAFFRAAQKRIGLLLVQPDIIGAQCLFLSGVYLMTMFRPVYAWRFFSQALAACQHLPFLARAQRSAASATPSEPNPGQLRVIMFPHDTQQQAVYWSAWKSERELRQELSLPDFPLDLHPGTSNLYPPFFPAPPQPSVGTPDGATDPMDVRARAAWLFYLAEISLRRLNSRLCSELLELSQDNTLSTDKFLDILSGMVPLYESQAAEWAANLPGELSIDQHRGETDDVSRSVLRGHLINLFELIYWPFVVAYLDYLSEEQPGGRYSPLLADLARRGLETHVRRLRANQPAFLHRHHGTFFMLKTCSRSAMVLVAAAVYGAAMPPGWRDAVYMTTGMLDHWSAEVTMLARWRDVIRGQLAKVPTWSSVDA